MSSWPCLARTLQARLIRNDPAAGAGELTFTVRLFSARDGERELDSQQLPPVSWPSNLKPRSMVRVWEEVVCIRPDGEWALHASADAWAP